MIGACQARSCLRGNRAHCIDDERCIDIPARPRFREKLDQIDPPSRLFDRRQRPTGTAETTGKIGLSSSLRATRAWTSSSTNLR